MNRVRRGLILTTGERYFGLAMSLATVPIVSRLLTPDEIGISVIGGAITAMMACLAEFAHTDFLIQKEQLKISDIRAAFSVIAFAKLPTYGLLIGLAPWIASVYGEPALVPYLEVVGVSGMLGVVSAPIIALLRRDLAFGKLLLINATAIAAGALATTILATLGASYMSFAWASLVTALVSGFLCLWLRPDLTIFKPTFRGWRGMLGFGGYYGAHSVMWQIYESVPALVLGRFHSSDTVGLYNRGLLMCQLPNKLLLGSVSSVILPALSEEVRRGGQLKNSYLRAVEYITAFQWPALITIIILAHPAVRVLFGHQWDQIIPIIRIMAAATLFSFASQLNYPILAAVGAIRDDFIRGIITLPLSAAVLIGAAFLGLMPLSFSFLLVIPFQAYVAFAFVRRHIDVSWMDLTAALKKSAAVAVASAIGPLVMIALAGFRLDISVAQAFVAVGLAGVGWLIGVWMTQHPLIHELRHARMVIRRRAASRRLQNQNDGISLS